MLSRSVQCWNAHVGVGMPSVLWSMYLLRILSALGFGCELLQVPGVQCRLLHWARGTG